MTVDDVIRILRLEPHPVEGGYFRETYRSASSIEAYGSRRSHGTAIYYLLSGSAVSEMHRLPGEEVFHFYAGDSVTQLQLFPDGTGREFTLGVELASGEVPQLARIIHQS